MNTRRKYLTLLVFLLLTKCSYCQSRYPQLVVIDGDSCALIDMKQVDSVNVMREQLSQEREIHKSLLNSVGAYVVLNKAWEKRAGELQEASDSLLSVRRNDKQELNNLNDVIKSQNKHIALLKIERDIFFVAAIVFAGIHYIK